MNSSSLNQTQVYSTDTPHENLTVIRDEFLPVAITWGILAGIAVIENLFVCFLFFLHKTLWTTTNLFVLSLSISDLLCAAVVAPVNILAHYYPTPTVLLLLGYSVGFVLLASVNNLAIVTYNRYLAIGNPLKYRVQMTHKKVIITIILVGWTLPLTVDLIPLAWDTDPTTIYNRIYINFYVIGFVLIPCFIMVFGYCKIFLFTRKFIRRSKGRSTQGNRTGERAGKEVKAARVFAVVFVMFLLCWCPIIMINVAGVIGIDAPDWIINISMFTFLLNTLTDPIMFTVFKPDFYMAMKRLLRCGGVSREENGSFISRRISGFSSRFLLKNKSSQSEKSADVECLSTSPPREQAPEPSEDKPLVAEENV